MKDAAEFERRVSNALSQIGYRVYGERLIGPRQVDLYAENSVIGKTQRVAVECRVYTKRLSSREMAEIVANVLPLYQASLVDHIIVVTEQGISPAATAMLEHQHAVQHITLAELESLAGRAPDRTSALPPAPLWGRSQVDTETDYCFVLMPFSDVSDVQLVYRNHIKPVLESKCGLRCERADDLYDISGVMQSVWEGINRAALIIAELTNKNANVFYELGIAHTLGKPVIMLSQSIDDVPFDLRHLRCILYNYKPMAIIAFEEALMKTVMRVLRR